MDPNKRNEKEKSPRETASILSIITFFYNFRLFKKGRKKDLEDSDLYEVPSWLSSQKLGDALEDAWAKQKKIKDQPSLLIALFQVFGKLYLFLGIVQFVVKTGLIYTQPYVLSKVVAYFEPNQTVISRHDLYIYAAVLMLLSIFTTMYNHNYQQFLTEVSVRVRTSVTALLFRKAVRLEPNAMQKVSIGNIVTLITKDVFAFENALTFVNDMWIGVIHICVITYLIFNRIGWSVLGGIGFYLLIIPIQLYVGRAVSRTRMKAAKRTDNRLQLTTETLRNIKTIKMYSWENYFLEKINGFRKSELKFLQPVYYLKAVVLIIAAIATSFSFFLMLITYILTGHYTDAETVSYIQACYASLRSYIQISIPFGISQCSDLYASVSRLTDFLMSEELVQRRHDNVVPRIFMKHVSSKIQESEVLKDISLSINKGVLIVTGHLGSGKSSVIKTILGEYPVTSGQMLVDGTISYAPEEPWLFPSTIRQNILFGEEYDEKRYNEVLRVCALTVDINKLEKGDQTIVGDRGINFSKGQQARINLARAVYRKSDIYIIDECLSALDGKVNIYIFKKCLLEFLKNKIVIVVTNNINHIKMVYGKDVILIENGKTLSLEKQKETLDKRITYYMDDVEMNFFDEETDINIDELPDEVDENTQLLVEYKEKSDKELYHEDKKIGGVKIGVYLRYYKYAGGLCMLFILLIIFMATQAALSYSDKVLSKWVNNEPIVTKLIKTNQTNTTEFETAMNERKQYLTVYSVMILATLVLSFTRVYMNFYFALRASKNLHKQMSKSVLNAFMSFFDQHLVGNVVNRFSKDMMTMDEVIPFITYEVFRNTLLFLGIIYLVVSVNISFLILAIFLVIKIAFIQRFYIPTGRSIKRLEASSRSPMIGYLNATLEGLPAVRASEKQSLLIAEFDKHQDHFTSASYITLCTSRFYACALDMSAVLFVIAVIIKLVAFSDSKAGDVNLAITQAMTLTGLLQWVIRQYTELENNMTGIERVLEYTDVKTENKLEGKKVPDWPYKGIIEYRDVCLTYNTTKTQVLNNVNFVIEPQERVGIVGRTGAGKSSIISTLFRLYDFEGSILIDGVDTKTLPLEFLRSRIAIIPQDPILFSGTIRSNLDPNSKYTDDELWQAMGKVHIKTLFLNLDEKITENGYNYSSGQRQLICLARALISKSKIIVLDEATSSMDPETCRLLQTTIRSNTVGCTVLTIAHKINTVLDCHRVMVVDHGEILEFDTPSSLRNNKNTAFYKMIKHSGLEE